MAERMKEWVASPLSGLVQGCLVVARSRLVGWLLWAAIAVAMALFLVEAARGEEEPEVIVQLRAQGAEIVQIGRQGGLDGYFVRLPDGSVYTLYVTDDGHAVNGLLYAPDGALVTSAQLEMMRRMETIPPPRPETVALEERFLDSLQGHGFTLGTTGPVVLVFADPLCRPSRMAVAKLAEQAVAGRLRVRVLPVGLLGEQSALRAMVVLSSEDPALEWFSPGVSVRGDAAGSQRVLENNRRFEAWGEGAVPLTLYRDFDEKIVAGAGDIEDVGGLVAALYRPPERVPGPTR